MRHEALRYFSGLLTRMKLEWNGDKTRRIDARTDSFDFLGYTFRWARARIGNRDYYRNIVPSKESQKAVRE